jgi:hypothetical protein
MTKYAPFAVSKAMQQMATLQKKEVNIQTMYKNLVRLDYNMKSGKLPQLAFRLELKKIVYVL